MKVAKSTSFANEIQEWIFFAWKFVWFWSRFLIKSSVRIENPFSRKRDTIFVLIFINLVHWIRWLDKGEEWEPKVEDSSTFITSLQYEKFYVSNCLEVYDRTKSLNQGQHSFHCIELSQETSKATTEGGTPYNKSKFHSYLIHEAVNHSHYIPR